MIRATLVYSFMAVYVLLLAPVSIAWSALSGNTVLLYRLARLCIRIAGWTGGIRVKVRGAQRILPGQTYLFLSNHQSNCDGPIVFYATRRDLRALVKREMMRLPLLSSVFRRVSFVAIDRSDPARARAGIDEGADRLRHGLSFFAFPEGTRSRNGELGAFKKGVFLMAIKAGVPVVPVTINRSRRVQPPGTYRIRPGEVEVILHDPIPTAGMSPDARDQLLETTHAAIASALVES
ncbi:MAG: 1-acyl-sn-glycerol-3-phosphate acyltransferase [Acidobacteria bacterium]|nr:1-acyl-sn-glycerol-3-phosphate acyltransferase [Acidobacteriota bacterium]